MVKSIQARQGVDQSGQRPVLTRTDRQLFISEKPRRREFWGCPCVLQDSRARYLAGGRVAARCSVELGTCAARGAGSALVIIAASGGGATPLVFKPESTSRKPGREEGLPPAVCALKLASAPPAPLSSLPRLAVRGSD